MHGSRLIAFARRRLRLEAGARAGAWVAVPALTLVAVEGLASRLIELPDLRMVSAALLVLPLVVALAAALESPASTEVLRRAGAWVGQPALYLARAHPGDTRLRPILEREADTRANERLRHPLPRWTPSRLVTLLPLLYLPAILLVLAPGRRGVQDLLPAGAAQRFEAAMKDLDALSAPGLEEDHRRALQAALARVERDLGDSAGRREAIEEIRAAMKQLAGWKKLLEEAGARTPAVEPVFEALRAEDWEAAAARIKDLARRLAAGELDPADLREGAASLVAAIEGGDDPTGIKATLRRVAGHLARSEAGGLEGGLEALARKVRDASGTSHRLERTVVLLEGLRGTPGEAADAARGTPSTAPPLTPRDETIARDAHAFGEAQALRPIDRTILRNYFDQAP